MLKALSAALVVSAALALPALADGGHHKAGMAEGEIRKVDKDAKKITIKHGPIEKLDMPGMTMVFQVGDPAMLERVRTGDKVRFEAEKVGGAYKVTRIESAK